MKACSRAAAPSWLLGRRRLPLGSQARVGMYRHEPIFESYIHCTRPIACQGNRAGGAEYGADSHKGNLAQKTGKKCLWYLLVNAGTAEI